MKPLLTTIVALILFGACDNNTITPLRYDSEQVMDLMRSTYKNGWLMGYNAAQMNLAFGGDFMESFKLDSIQFEMMIQALEMKQTNILRSKP